MAKTNKADMSCARVKQYTASDVSKAERHNERKNETYENMNVIVERIPFNVHFKKPTAPTYMEQLKQMETDGQVSLRGLRKDATLFDEDVYKRQDQYHRKPRFREITPAFFFAFLMVDFLNPAASSLSSQSEEKMCIRDRYKIKYSLSYNPFLLFIN